MSTNNTSVVKKSILEFEAPKYSKAIITSLFNESNNNSALFREKLENWAKGEYEKQEGMTEEILSKFKLNEANAKFLAKQAGLVFKKRSIKDTFKLVDDDLTNTLVDSIPGLNTTEESSTVNDLFPTEIINEEATPEINVEAIIPTSVSEDDSLDF